MSEANESVDAEQQAEGTPSVFHSEVVPLERLKPHPKNYAKHPQDEIDHIVASIKANGVYRNVVVACDDTILAGHGVVEACKQVGLSEVSVVRLPVEPDDPRALRMLIGDNEIAHLGEKDDRALSNMLRGIKDDLGDLLGTGYDEMMLANLLLVTRPAAEVPDIDAAAEWAGAGMPEYEEGDYRPQTIITFRSEEDRQKLVKHLGIDDEHITHGKRTWSFWWPSKNIAREDASSVRFELGGKPDEAEEVAE